MTSDKSSFGFGSDTGGVAAHTPEPWHCYNDAIFGPADINMPIAHVLSSSYDESSLVATDGRRIVACVNACIDIDTEALEIISKYRNEMPGYLTYSQLKQQRDDLLAALRPFANYACGEPCDCHNCRARAAISRASRLTEQGE